MVFNGILPPETFYFVIEYAKNISYINHESIYQWLYKPPQKKEKLYNLLPRHHAKRGCRKRIHRGSITDRVSIYERPVDISSRQEVDHWEADLISFKRNRQHLKDVGIQISLRSIGKGNGKGYSDFIHWNRSTSSLSASNDKGSLYEKLGNKVGR